MLPPDGGICTRLTGRKQTKHVLNHSFIVFIVVIWHIESEYETEYNMDYI